MIDLLDTPTRDDAPLWTIHGRGAIFRELASGPEGKLMEYTGKLTAGVHWAPAFHRAIIPAEGFGRVWRQLEES